MRSGALSGVLLAVSLLAQAPDVTGIGPQIGARVSDFSLADQRGQMQSLKTVAGPKGTLVVFFRSADW